MIAQLLKVCIFATGKSYTMEIPDSGYKVFFNYESDSLLLPDSVKNIPPNKSYKIGISRSNLINLQRKIRKNIPIKLNKKTWNIITHYASSISLGNCAL